MPISTRLDISPPLLVGTAADDDTPGATASFVFLAASAGFLGFLGCRLLHIGRARALHFGDERAAAADAEQNERASRHFHHRPGLDRQHEIEARDHESEDQELKAGKARL